MPRKRKVSPNPASSVHPDDSSGVRDAATSPTRVKRNHPLRDSPRHYSTELAVKDEPGRGMGVRPTEEDSSESDPKSIEGQKEEAEEGVNKAIKGLARMERRLMRAVKLQQLEVQKSKVPVRRDDQAEQASRPRPTRNRNEDGAPDQLSRKKQKVAAERDTAESECEDDGGAAGVHDGSDDPTKSAEVTDTGAARPPAVNSSYLPLPWKGRLGYACLNTYLRSAKPPVFCSRTCRMSSIIDHRHPLRDPSQPPHPVQNQPDKTRAADVALGAKFVQELGLANARDLAKMIRWNDRYGIKFMRLSSEMFPFASHGQHGYKLEPFAAEVLAEVGAIIAELGHRVTMHPGQFTQLGSPRNEVIEASVRDLVYHDELLSLLRLPPQQDRDAVLVLHMGGVYGDKAAALSRFKYNYRSRLSDSIRARLVLENDDVSWSVHDLLPVCEELDIPLVLDWHHHNIIFDASELREGTLDVSAPELQERIRATWTRKGIRQKMHYSEPEAGAVTMRERRKHSPRVATLPPCPNDIDLMIEAKDKEQAVFELMRNFKLPGYDRIATVVPFEREDDERAAATKNGGTAKNGKGLAGAKKNGRGKKQRTEPEGRGDVPPGRRGGGAPASGVVEQPVEGGEMETFPVSQPRPGSSIVSLDDFAMGGPQNRVYWPPGMEDWLRPRKRDTKKGVKFDGEESGG